MVSTAAEAPGRGASHDAATQHHHRLRFTGGLPVRTVAAIARKLEATSHK